MSSGGELLNKATEAALGRLKEHVGGAVTVVLDQLDHALNLKANATGPMLDRLIAGADRGAKQLVTGPQEQGLKPIKFDLFYPVALAKIGTLPSAALMSRCIVIRMHPASKTEADTLRRTSKGAADENVRSLVRSAMDQHGEEFANAKPEVPAELINRDADKWRPLIAVADLAGGNWPRRAQYAALALEGEQPEREPHISLLCDVEELVRDWPREIIFSEELDREVSKFASSRHRGDWYPKSAKERGRLLGLVGLKAERRWHHGKQLRGYLVADIKRAGEQYLRPDTCDA